MEKLSRWSGEALGLLRIVTGLLFLEHGSQKLFGFPPGEYANAPISLSPMGLSGVFELVGGVLIVLGLLTRPVAFILSGMMAVAYWMVHFPQNPWPLNNGGDAAILFCFVFLYLVFAGPGSWSLDAQRRRR